MDRLPSPVKVGIWLEGMPDDDVQEVLFYTLTDIANDKVVVDSNYPLAGITLCFYLHVVNIRAATDEKIIYGQVHAEEEIFAIRGGFPLRQLH